MSFDKVIGSMKNVSKAFNGPIEDRKSGKNYRDNRDNNIFPGDSLESSYKAKDVEQRLKECGFNDEVSSSIINVLNVNGNKDIDTKEIDTVLNYLQKAGIDASKDDKLTFEEFRNYIETCIDSPDEFKEFLADGTQGADAVVDEEKPVGKTSAVDTSDKKAGETSAVGVSAKKAADGVQSTPEEGIEAVEAAQSGDKAKKANGAKGADGTQGADDGADAVMDEEKTGEEKAAGASDKKAADGTQGADDGADAVMDEEDSTDKQVRIADINNYDRTNKHRTPFVKDENGDVCLDIDKYYDKYHKTLSEEDYEKKSGSRIESAVAKYYGVDPKSNDAKEQMKPVYEQIAKNLGIEVNDKDDITSTVINKLIELSKNGTLADDLIKLPNVDINKSSDGAEKSPNEKKKDEDEDVDNSWTGRGAR